MKKKQASPWKSIRTGLFVLLALVVFAYGFEITDIDLEQLRSEQRQQSLQRVARALTQPDIFEFAQEEQKAMAPVYVTCPAGGTLPEAPPPDTSGPYITVTPAVPSRMKQSRWKGSIFIQTPAGRFASSQGVTQLTWSSWATLLPAQTQKATSSPTSSYPTA